MKVIQSITSENTSVRKISSIYNKFNFKRGSYILDVGCGKYYDDVIEMMSKKGCIACGYDPYNQDEHMNQFMLSMFDNFKPDYVVCSNVLNVIKEDECIEELLDFINDYTDDDTIIYFSIYQKNKNGIGEVTNKGYQRNMKTKDYIPVIEKHFNVTKVSGDFIECRKVA